MLYRFVFQPPIDTDFGIFLFKVMINTFLIFSRQDAKAVVQTCLASLRLGAKSKKFIDNHKKSVVSPYVPPKFQRGLQSFLPHTSA